MSFFDEKRCSSSNSSDAPQFFVLTGRLGTGEPKVSASGIVVDYFAFRQVKPLWQKQKHQLNQNLSASQTLANAGTFVNICDKSEMRRQTTVVYW
jgi:hypothetical protein